MDSNSVLTNGYALERGLPYGYKKDGSTDYTDYIQKVLDKYNQIVFPGFPILINDKGLTIRSNQKIYFKMGAKLRLLSSKNGSYQILRIHDVSNVSLFNVNIEGDKYVHLGKDGEWGMGISIRGASDINILNANISKCWGDGIYVAGTEKTKLSKNVLLNNVICNDNRRNGISVISAQDLTIKNPILTNTSGTAPMCGLDLEPNNNDSFLDRINIINPVTENNQYGISFYLTPLNGANRKNVNVVILGHIDKGSKSALQFGSKGNNISGTIFIDGASWSNNVNPLNVVNYEPSNGVQVRLKGIKALSMQNGKLREKQDVFFNLKRNVGSHTGIQFQ